MKMFMFLFEQLMVVQRQTIFKYHIETLKSPDPRDMALSLLPKIFFGFFCITYELGLYTQGGRNSIISGEAAKKNTG